MKNIVWRAASFWILFLSCRRKSNWLEGIQVKNHLDDGAKRIFFTRLAKLNMPHFN